MSFNFTCSVSGLPIAGGEPVRLILLQSSAFDIHNEYAAGNDSKWYPRALPIRARYDEYGSVKDVDPRDAAICQNWLDGMMLDLIARDAGERPNDPAVFIGMSFEQLIKALVLGRVKVRSLLDASDPWPGRPTSLCVETAMVREDVWRVLCRMTCAFDIRPDLSGDLQAFRKAAREAWSFYQKQQKLLPLEHRIGLEWVNREIDNPVMWFLSKTEHRNPLAFGPINSWQIFAEQEHTTVEVTNFLATLAQMSLVYFVLQNLRHNWRPGRRTGPQFGEWGTHVEFLKALLRIAEKKAKARYAR